MDETHKNRYLDGFFNGTDAVKKLISYLINDKKDDLIPKMLEDTELTALLLRKYNLVSNDEYEFLSEKADEEWENTHTRNNTSFGMNDVIMNLPDITGSLDKDRELKIRLLEKLSEECEDDLYNDVVMGIDDELYESLLKKYNIS